MLLDLLLFVAVVGLIVWLLSLLPIPAPFHQIIMVIGVIVCILAVLDLVFSGGSQSHFIGRWR